MLLVLTADLHEVFSLQYELQGIAKNAFENKLMNFCFIRTTISRSFVIFIWKLLGF